MLARVRLVGRGTPEDPYRVPLPTYRIVEVDYEKRVAIVEVPDWYFTDEEGRITPRLNVARLRRLYPAWYEREYEKHKKILEGVELWRA